MTSNITEKILNDSSFQSILVETQRKGKRKYVTADSPEALGPIAPLMRSDGQRGYVGSRDVELAWLVGEVGWFEKKTTHEAVPPLKRMQDNPETLPWIRHVATKAIAAIK